MLRNKVSTTEQKLNAKGYAPIKAMPNYLGKNLPSAVVFKEDKDTRFSSVAKIKNTYGTVTANDSSLVLKY